MYRYPPLYEHEHNLVCVCVRVRERERECEREREHENVVFYHTFPWHAPSAQLLVMHKPVLFLFA